MKINLYFIIFLFLVPFNLLAQNFENPDYIQLENLKPESLFKIGIETKSNDPILINIFEKKSFEEIFDFMNHLPTKGNNYVIHELVKKILNSNYNLEGIELNEKEDTQLFEIRINKLFDIAGFKEIDRIYSSTPSNINNENINLKRIEAYFLRNEYKNACDLLNKEKFQKSYVFGKFEIICNIINQDFDKARFNLALLKEINEPGNNLFIDLCYSIMGDVKISKPEVMSERLDKISVLNPILLSSLQIAEISPNFEHIKNSPTSFLTFILGSPSSSIEVKLYTAETLVKQRRIDNSMLAEIYQLIVFEPEEISNALNRYKALSPVRARSLLYQALINEKNKTIKFQIVKTLLTHAKQDRLFINLSFLIKDTIKFHELENLLIDDIKLIIDIFSATKSFEDAEEFLKIKAYENGILAKEFAEKEISLNLHRYIEDKSYFNLSQIEYLLDKIQSQKEYDNEKENILLISSIIFDFNEKIVSKIQEISATDLVEKSNMKLFDLIVGLSSIEKKDYFNSLKIIFRIFKDKKINELSELELFLVLKFLMVFEYDAEFKYMVNEILFYKK
jgi:hypothetical protein